MNREPVAAFLVLAVGNPSRGDDALGPALLDALQTLGADAAGDVELLTDFQLQVEHALDLQGRRAVLFVDAARPGAVAAEAGVALSALAPALALPALSHALSASAVLHVARSLGGPLPPAWQLAIEGAAFGLGEPISTAAQARLAPALALALAWIAARRGEAGAHGPVEAAHA
jgi:hydrogenase maturation protease